MKTARTLTEKGTVCNKNKELTLHTENVASDEKTIYYLINGVWYDTFTPSKFTDKFISSLSDNENFVIDFYKNEIKEGKYLNPLQIEICNALGLTGAEESNVKFKQRIEQRKEQERKNELRKLEEAKKAIQDAENEFINGDYIKTEVFEELLNIYKIKMHPRVKNTLRNNISEVSINSLKTSCMCNTAKIHEAVELLKTELLKKKLDKIKDVLPLLTVAALSLNINKKCRIHGTISNSKEIDNYGFFSNIGDNNCFAAVKKNGVNEDAIDFSFSRYGLQNYRLKDFIPYSYSNGYFSCIYNSYELFGSTIGNMVYIYTIIDGVKHDFIFNYNIKFSYQSESDIL